MKDRIWHKILTALAVFTLLPLSSCGHLDDPVVSIEPPKRYILNGTKDDSDANFDYYKISDGNGGYTYAVSLTDAKKKVADLGNVIISSQHNGHDITGIWHDGFYGSTVKTITLPNTLTVIDYEAFFLCTKLKSIKIPYSIEEIGDGAFYGCYNMEQARFQNSSISEDSSGATSCVVSTSGQSENAISCKLKTIPSFCFFRCSRMTELSLPSSIETIEHEAFHGCSSIHSSLYFNNIKIIRARAFQGCTGIEKVYISDTLFDDPDGSGIEEHAFNYCNSNLEFHFCGVEAKVSAWEAKHPYWGWKNDTGDKTDVANRYRVSTYHRDGSMHFDDDWQYTTSSTETTILKYNYETALTGTNPHISFPVELGGKPVTRIEPDVFTSAVKGSLKWLYLPSTLTSISNEMFGSEYTLLEVIDVTSKCSTETGATKRIDLSGITNLKYIGYRAFTNLPKQNVITEIKLPAKIRAIGDEAFCTHSNTNKHFPKLTTFTWAYNESSSCLETIGYNAFFKLGCDDSTYALNSFSYKNTKQPTTIVFPKTFKYFGMTADDRARYASEDNFVFTSLGLTYQGGRPGVFAGSPMLKHVIFKGGSDAADLIIPPETFVYNHALQSVVFEDRTGHMITFHSANSKRTCIGRNAGRDKNDFRVEPSLQTIVLPNAGTDLRIQNFAFQGNSRGAIYLTGASGSKMYGETGTTNWEDLIGDTSTTTSLSNVPFWNLIGDEDKHDGNYIGYWFTFQDTNATLGDGDLINRYGLDQKLPVYDNVYFSDTFGGVAVTVGNSSSTTKYFRNGKFAFVCSGTGNSKTATLTKYLYDLSDGSNSNIADVPSSAGDNDDYPVKKIGPSAFSAAFCDNTSFADYDLKKVYLPDSITEIGEYAFLRAYHLEEITAKDSNGSVSNRQYYMPSNLTVVGKNAFSFCNVKAFLRFHKDCLFYENSTGGNYVTSVFSNNFSLRRITFLNSSNAEGKESNKYKTTEYSYMDGETEVKCTSALYSKGTSKNANRLLIVLYRDNDYRLNGSEDCIDGEFNGQYIPNGSSVNPFLFGAYKMGYWMTKLKLGQPSKDGNNKIPQALFSGICIRTMENDVITLEDSYVYLHNKGIDFDTGNRCDLQSLSGNVLDMQNHALKGCDQLIDIYLPVRNGDTNKAVPDGLFDGLDNPNLKYLTENSSYNYSSGTTIDRNGILDLGPTGANYAYDSLGSKAFKGNVALKKFIAPDVAANKTFTIKSSAFEGCSNLMEIDFSNVKGKLILEGSCFKGCMQTTGENGSITWPSDAPIYQSGATEPTYTWSNWIGVCNNITNGIEVKAGAFMNCTGLQSLTIPKRMYILGDDKDHNGNGPFEGCTSLKSVGVDGQNKVLLGFGNKCFYNCNKLNSVAFGDLLQAHDLGKYCFSLAATETSGWDIELPETYGNIRENAFESSKITSIWIKRDAKIRSGEFTNKGTPVSRDVSIKKFAFRNCSSLVKVRIAPTAPWGDNYQEEVFAGCTALEELRLPKYQGQNNGFNLNINTSLAKNFMKGANQSVKIFTYSKYAISSSGVTSHWRTIGNTVIDIHFFVEGSSSDLNSQAQNIAPMSSTLFWYEDGNGDAIDLGHRTSNDGVFPITFEFTSYTITS